MPSKSPFHASRSASSAVTGAACAVPKIRMSESPPRARFTASMRKLLAEAARLERQENEKHAEDHGVGCDQPQDGESARARARHEQHAEDHRGEPAEDQP